MNEARKFAELLARLMGLKAEGKTVEFSQQAEKVLQQEYDTSLEYLVALPLDNFKQEIAQSDYSAEKLNALGQILYVFAEPFNDDVETASLLKKVLIIFEALEQKYHYQSFDNITKQNIIHHYLINMPDLTWKTISSEYLHKGPWATLRSDKCEMPDGRVVEQYYVLEYPNWVNAIAITEDNKILMVRQYRHAAEIVSLEIPGGVIDDGESPEHAIKRELLEETGYLFDDLELLSVVYPNPSTANNKTFAFLARGGKKIQEQSLDDHEEIVVEEYTIEEVKQLLLENKIMQSLHCTAIFYALVTLGELK